MNAQIVLEIGCNHKGSMEIAKDMINASKHCGADVVKFQKRYPLELLSHEQYIAPHPNPLSSYGKTYGEHREFLEFNIDQHRELKAHCESLGIIYSTSIWDMTSAKQVLELNPKMIKIPSAMNNHYELINFILKNFQSEIHISLGMTTNEEMEKLIHTLKNFKAMNRTVLYHCTSAYPVPVEELYLLEIENLLSNYKDDLLGVGLSGHHTQLWPDIIATSLGASYIERHFTLNKDWKGTDHSASLTPTEAKTLIQDIKSLSSVLKHKEFDILPIEYDSREKLKFQNNSMKTSFK